MLKIDLCTIILHCKTIDCVNSRGKTFEEGKMSYPEFVWFLLSEEDKKHPTA